VADIVDAYERDAAGAEATNRSAGPAPGAGSGTS
jgi:hypothetical protein